jgi:hypothetical protein
MPALNDRISKGLVGALLMLVTLPAVGAQMQAELLLYRIESPGEEVTFNRLLVTAAFLRLDKGSQDSGYILYDRRQRLIYSVDHENRSILVIDPPPLTETIKQQAPTISLQAVGPADAPEVGGVKPQQWVLNVAGKPCRNAFVLPGVMPKAAAAYGEYLRLLSQQQAQALTAIPAEFQDACDNAVHVFAADGLLRKGLPLNVWDSRGYRESLIDFRKAFTVTDNEFILPAGYARMPMQTGF